MIEEVAPGLYRIDIPLPKSPLKGLNSYLVKGPERNLLVDTGWKQKECLRAMETALKNLGVDRFKTDFFLTHMHSDHMGLLSDLITDGSTIYFNRRDADWYNAGPHLDDFVRFAHLNGFPEDELQASVRAHPGFRFRSTEKFDFHILQEGDRLDVGPYAFQCVETPGHSMGHMCLYDAGRKILIAGDHILADISPNIQLWSDAWNPLGCYLESLEKIDRLDVALVLPGHRRTITHCRERIRELREHHEKRFAEILSILRDGGKNAFQIGSKMGWDVVYESWDTFPVMQKWFAIGEVIAHLKYLDEKGLIHAGLRNGIRVYSLTDAPDR
jgi:glyoxylase-like metal-dependent hydrolase (beta-lactamase superfamily II)